MTYVFQDQANGAVLELDFPIGKAPEIGATIVHEGRTLTRLINTFGYRWAQGQAPARDDDRRAEQATFETPLYPGHVTDAELVKSGKAKTMGCSKWV